MNLTYSQTMPLLVIVLCLVMIGALGLIIYLIHRINQQNSAIDHLLTEMDGIKTSLIYQAHSIQSIIGTVHNLDSRVCGIQNSVVRGYPPVNGSRPNSKQPQGSWNGYTGARSGHESAKGVNPV